jgi:hypothetical protein
MPIFSRNKNTSVILMQKSLVFSNSNFRHAIPILAENKNNAKKRK